MQRIFLLTLALAACGTVDGAPGEASDAGVVDGQQPPPPGAPLVVFTDSFLNGWSSTGSWMSSVAIEGGALHLHATNAWEALVLAAPQAIATSTVQSLTFRAKGSGMIRVEGDGGAGQDVTLASDWTTVTVPIGSVVTTSSFTVLYVKNGTAGMDFYVDDIAFVKSSSSPPPPPPPPPSGSSVPTNPISFQKDQPFTTDSGTTNYVYVPDAYDATHQTPITLLVWLHGCGGDASGDVWVVSPGGAQSWITLAVGGREGACWDPDTDQPKVLAAIADIKTHFNIKPKGVVLGGYSSGGDLTYRTGFYNTSLFAGLLIENSTPFRDTGSTQAASLAAASWKIHIAHLAHLQDETYPIDTVRAETDAVINAGFPLERMEQPGTHSDDSTDPDLVKYLLPYMDAGWTAP
jgi:predicted esterase